MTEIIGSESLLQRIALLVQLSSDKALYRKTKDAEGQDYFLILNAHGDEVAEWDEQQCDWCLVKPPRPTGATENAIDLGPVLARIEQQTLKMELCRGQLNLLSPGPVTKKTVKRIGPK
ncbi:TPA: hypothetical protein ACXIJH_005170 [Serratia marcescens]